jgi:hypothetical protein
VLGLVSGKCLVYICNRQATLRMSIRKRTLYRRLEKDYEKRIKGQITGLNTRLVEIQAEIGKGKYKIIPELKHFLEKTLLRRKRILGFS